MLGGPGARLCRSPPQQPPSAVVVKPFYDACPSNALRLVLRAQPRSGYGVKLRPLALAFADGD